MFSSPSLAILACCGILFSPPIPKIVHLRGFIRKTNVSFSITFPFPFWSSIIFPLRFKVVNHVNKHLKEEQKENKKRCTNFVSDQIGFSVLMKKIYSLPTQDDYRPTSYENPRDGTLSSFVNRKDINKQCNELLRLWSTNPEDPSSWKEGYKFPLGSFVKITLPSSPWHNTVGKVIAFV